MACASAQLRARGWGRPCACGLARARRCRCSCHCAQVNFAATSVFKDAFNTIYDKGIWGTGGGGSGDGSSLAYTATVRALLPRLLQRYSINRCVLGWRMCVWGGGTAWHASA
jgi:hypothetical protein